MTAETTQPWTMRLQPRELQAWAYYDEELRQAMAKIPAVQDADIVHIEHVLSCDICTQRQADEKKLRKSRKKWKERAKAASRVARRLEEIVQEDARRFATIASVKPS